MTGASGMSVDMVAQLLIFMPVGELRPEECQSKKRGERYRNPTDMDTPWPEGSRQAYHPSAHGYEEDRIWTGDRCRAARGPDR